MKEIIWGQLVDPGNPESPIKELGRADAADQFAEAPDEYLKAAKRGINICFTSDNEHLVARLEKPVAAKGKKGKAEPADAGEED